MHFPAKLGQTCCVVNHIYENMESENNSEEWWIQTWGGFCQVPHAFHLTIPRSRLLCVLVSLGRQREARHHWIKPSLGILRITSHNALGDSTHENIADDTPMAGLV